MSNPMIGLQRPSLLRFRAMASASVIGASLVAAPLRFACADSAFVNGPTHAPANVIALAHQFDRKSRFAVAKSAKLKALFFAHAHDLEASHAVPWIDFESFSGSDASDGINDHLDLDCLDCGHPLSGVALATLQPSDALEIAKYVNAHTQAYNGVEDNDLVAFVRTGVIPAPDARTGFFWHIQVARIAAFAPEVPPTTHNLASNNSDGESKLFLILILGAVGISSVTVFRRLRHKHQTASIVDTSPPVWPPRRPDDWGRELQEKHLRAVQSYQNAQALRGAAGIRGGGGVAPIAPLIPSWEAHHRAEQNRDPLQIRWAQTDSGDWLRLLWGNRSRPAAPGQALPVFQSMQRQDTGQWVWIGLGSKPDFDWQRGPQRVQEYQGSDADGNTFTLLRPCGHPAYQEPFQLDDKSDTHGTADPLSDDDLADMGSAPSHYGPVSSPVASAAPVAPAKPLNASPGAFGSAAPLSDDDLFDMGAAGPQQPSTPPQAPPPHHKPPEPDPSSLAGIL